LFAQNTYLPLYLQNLQRVLETGPHNTNVSWCSHERTLDINTL